MNCLSTEFERSVTADKGWGFSAWLSPEAPTRLGAETGEPLQIVKLVHVPTGKNPDLMYQSFGQSLGSALRQTASSANFLASSHAPHSNSLPRPCP